MFRLVRPGDLPEGLLSDLAYLRAISYQVGWWGIGTGAEGSIEGRLSAKVRVAVFAPPTEQT